MHAGSHASRYHIISYHLYYRILLFMTEHTFMFIICYVMLYNIVMKRIPSARTWAASSMPPTMQVSLPGLDEEGRIRAWRSGMPARLHARRSNQPFSCPTKQNKTAVFESFISYMLQRMKDKNMRDLVWSISSTSLPDGTSRYVGDMSGILSLHMLSLILNLLYFGSYYY